MNEYLLEMYLAHSAVGSLSTAEGQARRAAAELSADGTPVELVRSIFVPADETCFLLWRAPSQEAVEEAARRAGLQPHRVSVATSDGGWS